METYKFIVTWVTSHGMVKQCSFSNAAVALQFAAIKSKTYQSVTMQPIEIRGNE